MLFLLHPPFVGSHIIFLKNPFCSRNKVYLLRYRIRKYFFFQKHFLQAKLFPSYLLEVAFMFFSLFRFFLEHLNAGYVEHNKSKFFKLR